MTVTTIRPNATPSGAGNYTINGSASTTFAALADNLDSTFIQKTQASTASIILGFGTFNLSGSQLVKRVRLRAKARTTESDSKFSFQLGLKTGAVSVYGPAYSLRGVNASATYEGPYYSTAPDGSAWSQDAIDAIRVQVTDYRANAARGYLYELYVDVDIAAQPTASVTAPTASVTVTSAPEVDFTFTDTDGDSQSYYRIKVYTQAQYTASTFDPDESIATWDSGDVNSTDTSRTVGVYLANGVYRAYVKVAKDVNGSPFWSPWAYSQFTMAVAPPTVPTVTATYSDTYNRVAVEAVGASAAGFDYQRFAIERSDDQVTWVSVRDGDDLSPNATYLATVLDYEAARGQVAYYRARSLGTTGENTVSSAWSASASVTVTNDGVWWWKAITAPSINMGSVRVLDGLEESTDEDIGVFRPKGRTTALVVAGSLYGVDGTYRIATHGTAEFAALDALIRHQGVILVQDPFGRQKYVRLIGRSAQVTGAATAPIRRFAVQYVEVES